MTVIKGQKQVLKNLALSKIILNRQTKDGIEVTVNKIFRESKLEVPLDEAELLKSAFTKGRGLNTTIGYNMKYAAIQHENMQFMHNNGRKAKYLEDPVKRNKKNFPKDVRDKIKIKFH